MKGPLLRRKAVAGWVPKVSFGICKYPLHTGTVRVSMRVTLTHPLRYALASGFPYTVLEDGPTQMLF
ncbi:hypothetical protein CEP54_014840 [Fusarium duplospermum]|uniref:Uncharacterized protein n=1 Tax=Fusarium duplospermum TaxID=1325734 RepID=A0A428NTK7_9HYPO|nr:hypothetical protein CEP54_014840 [Fusarium duplospermum]